jgi:acetate---CoA ligase (ADP-forming)
MSSERVSRREPSAAADKALPIIDAARERGQNTLSEHEAKAVLQTYGIPVTREQLVTDLEQLAPALSGFEFPVVLKVDSPDILHKTEAGLVALGCDTPAAVEAEYHRILGRAKERHPSAVVNGVLIQEMVTASVAECILGMKKDPQFGPTILFGLGGIFVEIFEDVALRVAPLTKTDAATMIRDTKGYKLLAGARGRPEADVSAIEDALLRLSRLALDLETHLSEIDINPLMVGVAGAGAKAADAVMVLDAAQVPV